MITVTISRKGGVGKTTSTVNLAAALAEKGQRVLLVDLDSQASASLSLGVPHGNLSPSSADVLLRGTPIREVIRRTGIEGLDLVTASVDLLDADAELGTFRGRHLRLRPALAAVTESYDHIFLDCPSGLSVVAGNALAAADAFIAPTTPHFLSISGLRNLLDAAERIAWDAGTRIRLLGILLTLVDYRTKLTRRSVDQIRTEYGRQVFAIEVRTNTRLAEAPEQGQSIFQYDPRARGAEAYRLLADEYLIRCSEAGRG